VAEDFGEVVRQEFFNFFYCFFFGTGQQFQVAKAISRIGGQSYFVGEGRLAVSANQAVDGAAEVNLMLDARCSMLVSRFAIDTVAQDRLQAGLFEQGELEQYQKGQHIEIFTAFIGIPEKLQEVVEKLRVRVVIVGEFI